MVRHKLRDLVITDATWIFEACQDQQIQYWTEIPRPYEIKHAEAFVRGEFPEYKIWVIENGNSTPVGVISIHSVDELGDADIGYWVAEWGRGNGAGRDAIKLVEDYAKSNPKIKTISARISDFNEASKTVAKSAGLKRSETADLTCPAGSQSTAGVIYRKHI